LRKPEQSDSQMILIEGGACYWHMVDLIWIILFPLVYLIR
jgi:nitric oxide reductase NorE protein